MAYFIYVQNPHLNTNMFSDDIQGFSNHINNTSYYSAQNIFMTSNFNTASLNFT